MLAVSRRKEYFIKDVTLLVVVKEGEVGIH